MFLEAKDGWTLVGLVGTYAFEHAHAIVQGVSKDVGGGVAPRHHLAIIPNQTIAVVHRHLFISETEKTIIVIATEDA